MWNWLNISLAIRYYDCNNNSREIEIHFLSLSLSITFYPPQRNRIDRREKAEKQTKREIKKKKKKQRGDLFGIKREKK